MGLMLTSVWQFYYLATVQEENFCYLCLYEKLLSHMTTLVLGTIHLKVEEKESIMSQSMQDREISPSVWECQPGTRQASSLVEIPTPRVRFLFYNLKLTRERWFTSRISI